VGKKSIASEDLFAAKIGIRSHFDLSGQTLISAVDKDRVLIVKGQFIEQRSYFNPVKILIKVV
jgi:hypothetical protein